MVFLEKGNAESGAAMQRVQIPKADAILGQKFNVLDHGFLALVDYMGNDSSIVQAARVSYGSGTKTMREDEGLIRYLMRHEHTTPFEMVEFKFMARMPIFVARQWVRHRTASINEYSARYSIVPDEYYVPEPSIIQAQSSSNKQGREDGKLSVEMQVLSAKEIKDSSDKAYELYSNLIKRGVARELARMVLPINFYTEWYWKSNLHNTFHFLALRLDPHAQWEIRQYAVKMAEIVKIITPVAYGAFEDFMLSGIKLSKKEQIAIAKILDGQNIEEACNNAKLLLRKDDGKPIKTGEGPEFLQKLETIKENAHRFS
ncbi:MAG: FAD-dependent thymidylate synthase [Methanothrix sp.]